VISGNIAIMAYAFADYGARAWPGLKDQALWLTLAPVVLLSLLNARGIVASKAAQNLLTAAKVLGLAAVVAAGLFAAGAAPKAGASDSAPGDSSANYGLALVFVLYAYGGWAHAVFVAAEVRDQRRNVPRALIFALLAVAAIYLVVNGAYLRVLGYDAARTSSTPAADVLEAVCGPWGGRAVSVLVMISALGAINGMILTGTRVYAVWGEDYAAFRWLSAWDRRAAAPEIAIFVQALVAVLLILLVGTVTGRSLFDAAVHPLGVAGLPWEKYGGGFETLVDGSAPVFWGFFFLGGASVFVLRARGAGRERPYSMPLYPLPAILFCASSVWMFWSSLSYARWLTLIGVVPLAVGAVMLLFVRSDRRANP
jgi:amino acid transporter